MIIVIEGTDGSGKQTQVKKLYESLLAKGYSVKKQSFPNYESKSSGPVKMYLGGEIVKKATELDAYQASSLFAVDRLCTMGKYKDFLKDKNNILILDRYMESNMIHQACKIDGKREREKFIKWVHEFEFNDLKIPRPNLIFFLNMPIEFSLELAGKRADLKAGTSKDIHEQDAEYMTTAYNTGLEIAEQKHWKIIPCVTNGKIDSIETIQNKIQKIVFSTFDKINQFEK